MLILYDYAFAPVKEELHAFHICHACTVDGPECTLMQRLYMSSFKHGPRVSASI